MSFKALMTLTKIFMKKGIKKKLEDARTDRVETLK